MNLQVPCIMAKFVFQDLLSLNGVVVPKVKETMQVFDPHKLAGDLQLDLNEHLELEVDLVSFKASADAQWICNPVGSIKRWWRHNSSTLTLLQELKDLIKSKKPQKG